MPGDGLAAETVVEPLQERFGQRDLGQQDQCPVGRTGSRAATASKYTSVLPDPVTPSSNVGANRWVVTSSARMVAAACWSALKTGGA